MNAAIVDPEMLHNRARHFDSAIGRWMSQEPLGFHDRQRRCQFSYPLAYGRTCAGQPIRVRIFGGKTGSVFSLCASVSLWLFF
jgi:hypothetical protein